MKIPEQRPPVEPDDDEEAPEDEWGDLPTGEPVGGPLCLFCGRQSRTVQKLPYCSWCGYIINNKEK